MDQILGADHSISEFDWIGSLVYATIIHVVFFYIPAAAGFYSINSILWYFVSTAFESICVKKNL